jgi:hypothetical protein
MDISTPQTWPGTMIGMWWRRAPESDPDLEAGGRFESFGTMLMEMDVKLDRILVAVEDEDDGGEEEAEADQS